MEGTGGRACGYCRAGKAWGGWGKIKKNKKIKKIKKIKKKIAESIVFVRFQDSEASKNQVFLRKYKEIQDFGPKIKNKIAETIQK